MLSVPLAGFACDAQAHVARIKATKAPEAITVDGREEVVMLDAATYEASQERLRQLNAQETTL